MAENQTGNAITLTNEQFATLLQQIQISAANVPTTNIAHLQGNFSRCMIRFNDKTSDVEAFIDAIVTYKDCTNISDENALKGLPILLTDLAATWWQGVKNTINTWDTAIELLRQTYGSKKLAYRIYHKELFSGEQKEDTPTDIFVCKARALLSKLPYATPLSESIQIDMIYGLLSYKIRREISREKITLFSELLDLAREIEENRAEMPEKSLKQTSPRKQETRPRCKYCKNFGHTVDDCRTAWKKRDEGAAAPSKKNRDEIDADETNS